MQAKSSFLQEFIARGYFYQATNIEALDEKFANGSVSAYIGFDATAKSLHIGNLMQIMIFRLLQKHGHKPIVVMGGATTLVGDPSGKDETRKLLTEEDIAENIAAIKNNFNQYIKFGDGASDAIMVNNADWLKDISYITFLREFGRFFSVNRMLTMDSVKLRLEREQNLSFLEFNYMLMQAYDFAHLFNNHNCILQFGGSDQWGNIVSGTDAIRRIYANEAYGVTTPLITSASGAKMGKSVSGAVWLNKEMYSSYDYWQYWRNVDDRDVFRFMRLYTDLSLDVIAEYENGAININEAKKILATEATKLCHGDAEALNAEETARKVFEEGGIGSEIPSITLEKEQLQNGVRLYEIMRELNLVATGAEAKRLIKSNAVKVNDIVVVEENYKIDDTNVVDGKIKIAAGKKKFGVITIK
jgi:tyrosyl-tRNA synthetase